MKKLELKGIVEWTEKEKECVEIVLYDPELKIYEAKKIDPKKFSTQILENVIIEDRFRKKIEELCTE